MVSENFQEVIEADRQLESTVQPLVGLGLHSLRIEDVDRDALRLALLKEVEQPAADVPDCSVQAESVGGRCHVCLTAQTKARPRNQAPVSAHQEHQEGNCVKQEQQPAARQIWYRFEGRSRPAEVKPGRGKEAEEDARRDLVITSENQIYLIAGGRVVSWEEVTMMEENTTVGVTCAMRGGGRKKRKERNPWNSSEESSTGETSTQGESDGRDVHEKEFLSISEAEELWMETIKKQLQNWSRKSLENGTMKRFVEQTAQMGPGQRDEAIRGYSEALLEFPEGRKEMAVSQIRWMVEEKAGEMEKERMSELIRQKDEEGYFRKGNGPNEEFDFGKHHGKSFKEVFLWDQDYCQWTLQQSQPQARQLMSFKYFLRRIGDITDKAERKREKKGDWVVAKLRQEVRDRLMEAAKELGEEENEVVKDVIAGRVRRPENTKKQRWADMEESEATEQSEMEGESVECEEAGREKRKTNWAALLEVAREKDGTTAESNEPEKEWGVREGKMRSGIAEKRKGTGSDIAHGA